MLTWVVTPCKLVPLTVRAFLYNDEICGSYENMQVASVSDRKVVAHTDVTSTMKRFGTTVAFCAETNAAVFANSTREGRSEYMALGEARRTKTMLVAFILKVGLLLCSRGYRFLTVRLVQQDFLATSCLRVQESFAAPKGLHAVMRAFYPRVWRTYGCCITLADFIG